MQLSMFTMLSLTLIFLNYPAYTSGQLDEAKKALIKLMVEDLYGPAKTWLWYYAPTIWSIPYKCPDSAVKYLRDPPHNWYIAPREKDIDDLKKLFDRINNSDKRVSVVHIFGVPGSGKTELARQFGNSVYCKPNGSSTVLTLNAESPEQFRNSLITSIWEIKNSEGKEFNTDTKEEITVLANKLKHLLKKRPGWLLIVDNIRDPDITKKDMYRKLPTPGTGEWGTGKMLVTTQFPLEFGYNEHIRVKPNEGLTSEDATNFLCKLVEQKTKRTCDTKVSKEIVKELEYFPLSILAAGDHISRSMNLSRSYSWRDYLTEHAAVKKIPPAHDYPNNKFGYRHSMLSALRLTIKKTREVYPGVFCDFIALTGFTTVNQGYISSAHVKKYLEGREHKINDNVLVLDFPLVYLSQEKFHIHQVVSFAFREELEGSETDEMLQYILRNISLYFADQYSKSDIGFEIVDHFNALVQNLPTRCPNFSGCLIALESKTEHLEAVSILIFETYSWVYRLAYRGAANISMALNCSKLDTFLLQLGNSPNYNNQLAIHIRFTGYQALYNCLRTRTKVNGTFSAATAAIQLITEVAPERPELHTVPVSWILLSLTVEASLWEEILLNNYDLSFRRDRAFFNFVNRSAMPMMDIRHKRCSSLLMVTNNLNLQLKEIVEVLCTPDLNNSTIMTEMIALISSVHKAKGPVAVSNMLPLKLKRHIRLGRSYGLGLFNAGIKNSFSFGSINPYGACYKGKKTCSFPDVTAGRIFEYYIDYDKRVGLKSVEIASGKYCTVYYFLELTIVKMERTRLWDYNEVCRCVENQLKALYKQWPTFSAGTELVMQNTIGPIMESFLQDFLTFVDNYCENLLYILYIPPLGLKFQGSWHQFYPNRNRQFIEEFLDTFRRSTSLQQDRTKEIAEMLLEIITGTIHFPNNNNFAFAVELIPSDQEQTKSSEFLQQIYRYRKKKN